MTKETIDLSIAIIAFLSLGVAIMAWLKANSAENRALVELQTKTYLAFRERFQEIKQNLPHDWESDKWLPVVGSADWRKIERYWQNAFDEWFVLTNLSRKHLERVWGAFFRSAVAEAITKRPLRYVIWRLSKDKEFGQFNIKFQEELEKLLGRPLDADFKLPVSSQAGAQQP